MSREIIVKNNGRKERIRHVPREDGRVDIIKEVMTRGNGWRVVGDKTVDSVTVIED